MPAGIGGLSMRPVSRSPVAEPACTARATAPSDGRCPGLHAPGYRGGTQLLRPRPPARTRPVEVVTDRAPVYPRVIGEELAAARHGTDGMPTVR
jgi:hypothetical protein